MIEFILRDHRMCQFPCERYCEVQLGIALLVHERCHLDGLFNDVLLVWSVTLQLQGDIVSYLGDLRVWFIPFPGLRMEQMVIEDDPIDEDGNGFDELGIADADSDTAFIVGAVPALLNAVLHADAALHWLTTVVAPNEVTEQVDGIVFLFAGIALPRRFQADCRFIHMDLRSGYTSAYSTSFKCTRNNYSVKADEKSCNKFEADGSRSNATIARYDK